jgi:hypothetical protein
VIDQSFGEQNPVSLFDVALYVPFKNANNCVKWKRDVLSKITAITPEINMKDSLMNELVSFLQFKLCIARA